MNDTEKKQGIESQSQREIKRIEEKTLELINEVNEIKKVLKETQKPPASPNFSDQAERETNVVSLIEYIDELLKTATQKIINEIRGEFYRLFNSLADMGVIIPSMESLEGDELGKGSSEKNKILVAEERAELNKNVKNELAKLELYRYLLTERETLIYELTDRLIAVETDNNKMKERLEKLEEEKEKWEKQKEFLSRLLVTDPRYKIITILKQAKIIAPMQLSFVLGVSLGQVKEYLKQLETMKIIAFNDDGSVQLHDNLIIEDVSF